MTSALEANPEIPRLLVTGHPNHELAILGFVQRMRPHILFLTDGGAEARSAESRAALAKLGLAEHAQFLGVPEGVLYRALVDRNTSIFSELAAAVRREVKRVGAGRSSANRSSFTTRFTTSRCRSSGRRLEA